MASAGGLREKRIFPIWTVPGLFGRFPPLTGKKANLIFFGYGMIMHDFCTFMHIYTRDEKGPGPGNAHGMGTFRHGADFPEKIMAHQNRSCQSMAIRNGNAFFPFFSIFRHSPQNSSKVRGKFFLIFPCTPIPSVLYCFSQSCGAPCIVVQSSGTRTEKWFSFLPCFFHHQAGHPGMVQPLPPRKQMGFLLALKKQRGHSGASLSGTNFPPRPSAE